MSFECVSINGFAGDRTQEAMQECHGFVTAFANHFEFPYSLVGEAKEAKDLQWDSALLESRATFLSAIAHLERILLSDRLPVLVTPRCATAIATLPKIIARHPDVVVLYFDAHGDLNLPDTSESGYLGGMPITAVLGEWESGYGQGLKTDNLVHIGGRDLDALEKEYIEKNRIATVSKKEIEGDLSDLIAIIKNKPVFIHLDTDVFDPAEVTAEYAVDNGLFRHHVKKIVETVLKEAHLIGLEITELSPRTSKERKQSCSALFDSFQGLKTMP